MQVKVGMFCECNIISKRLVYTAGIKVTKGSRTIKLLTLYLDQTDWREFMDKKIYKGAKDNMPSSKNHNFIKKNIKEYIEQQLFELSGAEVIKGLEEFREEKEILEGVEFEFDISKEQWKNLRKSNKRW